MDSGGEAWWHWLIGAAIVAGCAIAVIATAGGVAPAIIAVAMVGNGMAATTVAASVSAGAFIGSSIAFGTAGVVAALNSRNISEFYSQGNWGTVASIAGSGIAGGAAGYLAFRESQPTFSADKKLDKIIKNPKRIQRYTPEKFQKVAKASSWNSGITRNDKGFRACNGRGSLIMYNMNGTRHDALHFYGNPYWKVSPGNNKGAYKYPMR